MNAHANRRRKPPITLCQTDHEKLSRLALSVAERNQAMFDALQSELERARVVPDARLSKDVVRMGSTLRYSTDSGEARTVTLVFPAEADISAGRISILTPIGAALIGLSAGQTIEFQTPAGGWRSLTVIKVN